MSRTEYGKSRLNNYEILSVVGQGAYGDIKKAKNKQTGEIVAIKIINILDQPYYKNEINILTALAEKGCTKHILCLIESFKIGNFYYIVTEYVEGETLDNFLITIPCYLERRRDLR